MSGEDVHGGQAGIKDSRLTELTELMNTKRGGLESWDARAKSIKRRRLRIADSKDARDLLKSTG